MYKEENLFYAYINWNQDYFMLLLIMLYIEIREYAIKEM